MSTHSEGSGSKAAEDWEVRQCPECGIGFVEASDLETHMKEEGHEANA